MQYWKIVEAGDYETYSAKILNLFHTEKEKYFLLVNSFWNQLQNNKIRDLLEEVPELKELEILYGTIKQISLLILDADTSTLHIDHTIGLNKDVKARLNIPVLNCKGSITAFFKFNEKIGKLYTIGPDGTKTWPYLDRYFEKSVTQVELIQPTILRTSEPHTVLCKDCEFPRISLTISFENDIARFLE